MKRRRVGVVHQQGTLRTGRGTRKEMNAEIDLVQTCSSRATGKSSPPNVVPLSSCPVPDLAKSLSRMDRVPIGRRPTESSPGRVPSEVLGSDARQRVPDHLLDLKLGRVQLSRADGERGVS